MQRLANTNTNLKVKKRKIPYNTKVKGGEMKSYLFQIYYNNEILYFNVV